MIWVVWIVVVLAWLRLVPAKSMGWSAVPGVTGKLIRATDWLLMPKGND